MKKNTKSAKRPRLKVSPAERVVDELRSPTPIPSSPKIEVNVPNSRNTEAIIAVAASARAFADAIHELAKGTRANVMVTDCNISSSQGHGISINA